VLESVLQPGNDAARCEVARPAHVVLGGTRAHEPDWRALLADTASRSPAARTALVQADAADVGTAGHIDHGKTTLVGR
jgi:hypothetical protein